MKDYPTLRKVIGYVADNSGAPAQSATEPVQTPAAPAVEDLTDTVPGAPRAIKAADAAVTGVLAGDITADVVSMVAERTGYPEEMLELDLDMEADLGIDTVKQAELLAELREKYGLPENQELQLKDYPTLRKVIGYVSANSGAPVPVAEPAVEAARVADSNVVTSSVPETTAPTSAPAVSARGGISESVVAMVAARTGYPAEMLELDLDMEADLGIDTVKQAELIAELREKYSLPESENLQLKDYPTLRHVIGYVESFTKPTLHEPVSAAALFDDDEPEPAPPIESPKAAVPTPAPAPAAAIAGGGRSLDDVKAAVAALTGFPTTSIKSHMRVGDLGLVASDVYADQPQSGDITVESLVSGEAAAPAAVPEPTLVPVAEPPPLDPQRSPTIQALPVMADISAVNLRRMVLRLRGSAAANGSTGIELSNGDVVVVTGDNKKKVTAVAKAIKAAGGTAKQIPLPKQEIDPIDCRGLVFVGGSATALFCTVKSLHESLNKAGAFVLAVGERDLAGFCKSIRREWEAPSLIKAVVVRAGKIASSQLMEELHNDGSVGVVHWADGARWAEDLEIVEVDSNAVPRADDETWVVTGGAQGITAEIVRGLCMERGGNYHLLGRTELPEVIPDALPKDDASARKQVMDEMKATGEKAVPTAVLSEVKKRRAQRSIADLLAELNALPGVTAAYHRADVNDAKGIKAVIKKVAKAHSRIDWLVHAAGLEISRPIDRKPLEEFERVLSPKTVGVDNLLGALDGIDVGAVVGFGSIAGRFGNAAQCDYSAANESMCQRLNAFATSRPGTRWLQLDWTAWSGAGMATRGSVAKLLEAAGIGFLPLNQGSTVFRRLVASELSGEIVVDCGIGMLEPAPFEPFVPPAPLFFGTAAESSRDGSTVSFTWPLHATSSWLDDHRIDGTAVLPGVMGLEAFAQSSRSLFPGLRVLGFENVNFDVPLKLHGERPVTARVDALALPPDTDGNSRVRCRLMSRFTGPSGNAQGPERQHFSATVKMGADLGVTQPVKPNGAPMKNDEYDQEKIYDLFFHGQSFQVLEAAENYQDGMRARVASERLDPPVGEQASAPMALEALFQAAGLWQIVNQGKMGLPSMAQSVTIYGTPAKKRTVECFTIRHSDGSYEALLRDEDGRVYMALEGYEMATMPDGSTMIGRED